MDAQIIEYDINEAYIAEVTAKYGDIKLIPDDKDSYAMVMSGLKAHREIRLAIEKKRKSNNERANKYIKNNNDRAKELHALNDPGEQRLKDMRQAEDNRIEAIEKKRVSDIREKIINITLKGEMIGGMNSDELLKLHNEVENTSIEEEEFQEFMGEAMAAVHNTLIIIRREMDFRLKKEEEGRVRKEEEERLAKQKKAQEAEEKRLKEIKEEQERIAAEQWAKEEEIRKKKEALEAEKKAAQEEKEREEREARIREEERIKAIKETAEKAEREAEERVRQEALKPDKKKLEDFANNIMNLPERPEIKDCSARGILSTANEKIQDVSIWIMDQIGGL